MSAYVCYCNRGDIMLAEPMDQPRVSVRLVSDYCLTLIGECLIVPCNKRTRQSSVCLILRGGMIIQLACRKVLGSFVMSNRRNLSDKLRRLLTFLGYVLCGYTYF